MKMFILIAMIIMAGSLIISCETVEADVKEIIQEGVITSWEVEGKYVIVYFQDPDPDDGRTTKRSCSAVKVHTLDSPAKMARVTRGYPPAQPTWDYFLMEIWLSKSEAKELKKQMR